MSLRSCDCLSYTIQSISDSEISKQFSLARQKASYIIQDGIGPLLENDLCRNSLKAEGAFTLMFDAATTLQRKKQMDILIHSFLV